MSNLIDKTKNYINFFDKKDLEAVMNFFDEDSVLFDPGNPNGVKGKKNISKIISSIFTDHDDLSFISKNIFYDKDTTIIEFELALNKKKLVGVDIIEWKDGLIKELRAYLY